MKNLILLVVRMNGWNASVISGRLSLINGPGLGHLCHIVSRKNSQIGFHPCSAEHGYGLGDKVIVCLCQQMIHMGACFRKLNKIYTIDRAT